MKYHFNQKTFILTLLLLLPLTQVGYAQEACSSAVDTIAQSLDRSYKELVNKYPTSAEKASAIPGLLNRALSPMVKKFGDQIDLLSSPEIVRRLKDFQTHTPIYGGEYIKNVAQIPRLKKSSQELVNRNSKQVVTRYKIDQAGGLIHTLNEHVYVDYSEARVQDLGLAHELFGAIVTPVGQYGREFAEDMLRTTQILIDYATHNMKEESRKVFESAPVLLQAETARGQGSNSEKANIELTPLSGMIEGILTFHQMTSLLLSYKVAGIHDGGQALRLLVHSGETKAGLASEITMQIPMGVVGPSSLSGFGFRDSLMLDRVSGKLKTTSSLKALLKYLQTRISSEHKRVCPMASLLRGLKPSSAPNKTLQPSGIQIIAESYLKVFELVRAQRP